jgi:hypothetical protein
MPLDIDAALAELEEKDHLDIERETAYKWASRAIAAYSVAAEADLAPGERVNWMLDANDYEREAVEHAADDHHLLDEVMLAMTEAKQRALGAFNG